MPNQIGDCVEGLKSVVSLDRIDSEANFDFISHAHTDHIYAVRRSKSTITSDETADLIEAAYGLNSCRVADVPEGTTMLDSGHMLGSKQLCVDSELYGRIVYSGDFQTDAVRSAKPIEITDCDALIIDSTYPRPDVHFKDRAEVESDIIEWVEKYVDEGIVLFKSYAMGKAQELVKILNKGGIKPAVSDRISHINSVYRKHGVELECFPLFDGGECQNGEFYDKNFVAIVESSKFAETAMALHRTYKKLVFTAVATGFAEYFRLGTDMQFGLSDHADFARSMEYIERSGAKRIFTYGKNSELFAHNLKKFGYDAEPFGCKHVSLCQKATA
ncbi:MAG: hypothetical protein LVQ97_00820 [Candidatus Micrarchaeales archaeon]|nr:hypothetical protein [Candidatus Micrarchaeales archaeon]